MRERESEEANIHKELHCQTGLCYVRWLQAGLPSPTVAYPRKGCMTKSYCSEVVAEVARTANCKFVQLDYGECRVIVEKRHRFAPLVIHLFDNTPSTK